MTGALSSALITGISTWEVKVTTKRASILSSVTFQTSMEASVINVSGFFFLNLKF